MKIWILVLVFCSGVDQICTSVHNEPLEFLTYSECTRVAYTESFNLLYEGDYTPDDVDKKRFFTKWSCIPVFKPGQPI